MSTETDTQRGLDTLTLLAAWRRFTAPSQVVVAPTVAVLCIPTPIIRERQRRATAGWTIRNPRYRCRPVQIVASPERLQRPALGLVDLPVTEQPQGSAVALQADIGLPGVITLGPFTAGPTRRSSANASRPRWRWCSAGLRHRARSGDKRGAVQYRPRRHSLQLQPPGLGRVRVTLQ